MNKEKKKFSLVVKILYNTIYFLKHFRDRFVLSFRIKAVIRNGTTPKGVSGKLVQFRLLSLEIERLAILHIKI